MRNTKHVIAPKYCYNADGPPSVWVLTGSQPGWMRCEAADFVYIVRPFPKTHGVGGGLKMCVVAGDKVRTFENLPEIIRAQKLGVPNKQAASRTDSGDSSGLTSSR